MCVYITRYNIYIYIYTSHVQLIRDNCLQVLTYYTYILHIYACMHENSISSYTNRRGDRPMRPFSHPWPCWPGRPTGDIMDGVHEGVTPEDAQSALGRIWERRPL